jgi:iron complex transport system ATP-binding protein
MNAMLQTRNLQVKLGGREVLSGIGLEVRAGELVALIGPNGAGKTTLLRALAGLVPAHAGSIEFDGEDLTHIARGYLARDLAYLPQGGGSHWAVPVKTLVTMGRLPHLGPWRRPGAEDLAAVERALTVTETAHLAQRPVTQLSGGERARVLLARALAGEPRLLLADEPVSGLDPYHRLEVMEHLQSLARGFSGHDQAGVVIVLHDLTLATRFCDRLVLMHGGRVIADGGAADVLSPDRLASVYRVRALSGREGRQSFVVPWERLDRSDLEGRSAGTGGGPAA